MTASASWLDVGCAGRPLPGQTVSGDASVIRLHGETAIVAVIDGLGHGEHAAEASEKAASVLRTADGTSLLDVLAVVHRALQRTRGAVLSMARFDNTARRMTWVGVGNVEGYLLRADGTRDRLLVLGGVVGHVLPRVRESNLPLAPGDLVVFATDGIGSTFPMSIRGGLSAQATADLVLATHATPSDDALVVAARYLGGP